MLKGLNFVYCTSCYVVNRLADDAFCEGVSIVGCQEKVPKVNELSPLPKLSSLVTVLRAVGAFYVLSFANRIANLLTVITMLLITDADSKKRCHPFRELQHVVFYTRLLA